MALRSLNTLAHSFHASLSQEQATPVVTAFPIPSYVSQPNSVSVQDILFGVLTIILAVASVILAYLQLIHMRKQARFPRPDIEMLSIRKHTFSMPYVSPTENRLDGPLRQDSNQSSSGTSGDTAVEVETPQEDHTPGPHSAGKSNAAVAESEIDIGVPSRKTTSSVAAVERMNRGKSTERVWTMAHADHCQDPPPAHNVNSNGAAESVDAHVEADATRSIATRQTVMRTVSEAPPAGDDAAPKTLVIM
jgi:hypothetical protein